MGNFRRRWSGPIGTFFKDHLIVLIVERHPVQRFKGEDQSLDNQLCSVVVRVHEELQGLVGIQDFSQDSVQRFRLVVHDPVLCD